LPAPGVGAGIEGNWAVVVSMVVGAGGAFSVGAGVGVMVGVAVGVIVGASVGAIVGAVVGATVEANVVAKVGADVTAIAGAGVVKAGAGPADVTQSFQPFFTEVLSAYHVMSSVGEKVCGEFVLSPWYALPLIVRKS